MPSYVVLLQSSTKSKVIGIHALTVTRIEENFKAFDKNGDGVLDKKELTGCLYSLGEERTSKEMKELMTKYGNAQGVIPYESYKELLIHVRTLQYFFLFLDIW